MRVRAAIAYDGTEYAGFQRQGDVATVQETIECALGGVTQEEITIVAAGRTDAGVHALGQVVAFDTDWRHGVAQLHKAMNAVLPPDIVVRKLEEADRDFHPRFNARRRLYRYKVFNGTIRSPLTRRYSLHVPYSLDVDRLDEAAGHLVGEHDFATFGQPPQGRATVRRVFLAGWQEVWCGGPFGADSGSGTCLEFDIAANAFLYRMVRSIVGTLLEVGQGRMSVQAFKDAFKSGERGQAGRTAEPHGLCLMEVGY